MYTHLRDQLLADLDRLDVFILRYAAGDRSVKEERDRLTESVEERIAGLGHPRWDRGRLAVSSHPAYHSAFLKEPVWVQR